MSNAQRLKALVRKLYEAGPPSGYTEDGEEGCFYCYAAVDLPHAPTCPWAEIIAQQFAPEEEAKSDPLGKFLDNDQLDVLARVKNRLYDEITKLGGDERRDLANAMDAVLHSAATIDDFVYVPKAMSEQWVEILRDLALGLKANEDYQLADAVWDMRAELIVALRRLGEKP